MRRSTSTILSLTAGLLLLAACSSSLTARKMKYQDDGLLYKGPEEEEIYSYTPDSKLFRIAVVDFVDQTQNTAGMVEDMFADVLTTQLYRTNRFTLYDRGALRRKNRQGRSEVVVSDRQNRERDSAKNLDSPDPTQSQTRTSVYEEKSSRLDDEYQAVHQLYSLSGTADGVLVGNITNAEMTGAGGSYTIDYRIVKRVVSGTDAASNAAELQKLGGDQGRMLQFERNSLSSSLLVIFADTATIEFSGNPMQKDSKEGNKPIALKRKDLEKIAEKVKAFFPPIPAEDKQAPDEPTGRKLKQLSQARVTDIDRDTVTINLGNDVVRPGYSFFVTTDPDESTGEFTYKGKFVIRDTFDRASRASLALDVNPQVMKSIRPGDRVLMK